MCPAPLTPPCCCGARRNLGNNNLTVRHGLACCAPRARRLAAPPPHPPCMPLRELAQWLRRYSPALLARERRALPAYPPARCDRALTASAARRAAQGTLPPYINGMITMSMVALHGNHFTGTERRRRPGGLAAAPGSAALCVGGCCTNMRAASRALRPHLAPPASRWHPPRVGQAGLQLEQHIQCHTGAGVPVSAAGSCCLRRARCGPGVVSAVRTRAGRQRRPAGIACKA